MTITMTIGAHYKIFKMIVAIYLTFISARAVAIVVARRNEMEKWLYYEFLHFSPSSSEFIKHTHKHTFFNATIGTMSHHNLKEKHFCEKLL